MDICTILAIILIIVSVILSFTAQPRAIEFALWAIFVVLICGAKVAF